MLVSDRMTLSPITVSLDLPVSDALRLMKEKKIRRFPVVDGHGTLVGIVSDKDLLYAAPSPTTSLSVFEINYLMAKLTVEKVMTKKVITVTGDTPLEEAARIMADSKVGGLPVMADQKLIGIITETDMFRAFIELFGGRRNGVRMLASISGKKGTFATITSAVSEAGGDIVGFGSYEESGSWRLTLKVQGVSKEKLAAIVTPFVGEILDIRET